MIYFPFCKINIGLFITGTRNDGFHNIDSIFYPLHLNDALEIREKKNGKTTLYLSGNDIEGKVSANNDNIVMKAYNMLKQDFPYLPEYNIYLHKKIPIFAGLGGGSSDGMFALKLLNFMAKLHLNDKQLLDYALRLGSDCAFFINSNPKRVSGRGEILNDISLNLSGYYVVLMKPNVIISTKEAYEKVSCTDNPPLYDDIIKDDIHNWASYLSNDFEKSIFPKYPLLKEIKEKFYKIGAIYAQMSGSGSTIYGIFKEKPTIDYSLFPKDCFIWQEKI